MPIFTFFPSLKLNCLARKISFLSIISQPVALALMIAFLLAVKKVLGSSLVHTTSY